jgi:hypothetical protein
MTYKLRLLTFVETRLFTRIVGEYLYYVRADEGVIWMLTIYAKNEAQRIAAHILRRIKEEIDG